MTAYTFTIRTRERGQLLGQAVICLEARYAWVQRTTAPRPDRKFATLAQWTAIGRELDDTLPSAPLENTHPIAQLLAGEQAVWVSIQYLSQEPIAEGIRPDQVIVELDQRLRQVLQA